MTYTLQIYSDGDVCYVVLPKEIMVKMDLKPKDELFVTETPDGVMLSKHDAEFDRQMEIAMDIMRREHDVLKRLADS